MADEKDTGPEMSKEELAKYRQAAMDEKKVVDDPDASNQKVVNEEKFAAANPNVEKK